MQRLKVGTKVEVNAEGDDGWRKGRGVPRPGMARIIRCRDDDTLGRTYDIEYDEPNKDFDGTQEISLNVQFLSMPPEERYRAKRKGGGDDDDEEDGDEDGDDGTGSRGTDSRGRTVSSAGSATVEKSALRLKDKVCTLVFPDLKGADESSASDRYAALGSITKVGLALLTSELTSDPKYREGPLYELHEANACMLRFIRRPPVLT